MLAISSAYKKALIGIDINGKVGFSELDANSKHSENMLPAIEKVMDNVGVSLSDNDTYAVVIGPGSFTGIRIGVTIGKTMAFLLNVPIKQIDSLIVKYISLDTKDEKYVVIDDKNGAYVGHFGKGKALDEYTYMPNSEYKVFKNDNEVIDEIEIDYNKVYEYLKNVKPVNAHEVKPLYIKGIDALK